MTSLSSINDGMVVLRGAPDDSTDIVETKNFPAQAMQIEMNKETLEELLACARSGKQPQISFGRSAILRFGGSSRLLDTRTARHRQEIYGPGIDEQDRSLHFVGLVSHNVALAKAEEATAGINEALESFRNNMVSMEKERDSRKTVIGANSSNSRKSNNFPSQTRLTPHLGTSKLASRSPDMSGRKFPDGVPDQFPASERQAAVRYALVHLLAIKPLSLNAIAQKLRCSKTMAQDILRRTAYSPDSRDEYTLNQKIWREIDPWGFPYRDPEDRQAVIDNTIRAYDRLRIDPGEEIWQCLLPQAERGRGITLSKLKLEPAKMLTPTVKAKVFAKNGLIKKETKKTEKSDKRELKKAEKASEPKVKEKVLERIEKKTAPPDWRMGVKRDNADAIKKREQKPKAFRGSKEVAATKPGTGGTSSHRITKESMSTSKASLNRPKDPSPLSTSPPVNASDLEDQYAIRKVLTSAASPSTGSGLSKRKSAESSHRTKGGTNILKKPKVDSTAAVGRKNAFPAQSSSLKRKMADDSSSNSSHDSTPLKVRRVTQANSTNNRPTTSNTTSFRPRESALSINDSGSNKIQDISSIRSSHSPDFSLSWRQRVELAQKFKRHYARYEAYHRELSGARDPPTAAQREILMTMHKQIADMKKQLAPI